MENNFAAIKSGFSGASAPSNPVAGMPWHDTSNNLYKVYYGAAWVTVYDLANDYSITARDCSRSVIAGTALTGGGALTGNVTLNHGSHTGDVSGTETLTIGSDKITPAKCYPGTLSGPSMSADDSVLATMSSETWNDAVFTLPMKCPSGAVNLRYYAQIYSAGAQWAYSRFTVSGEGTSTFGSVNGSTPTWDCGTVDLSGVAAGTVITLSLGLRTNNVATAANLGAFTFWWE
jgi:hypothetical protein